MSGFALDLHLKIEVEKTDVSYTVYFTSIAFSLHSPLHR